jgi:hypothetical protein
VLSAFAERAASIAVRHEDDRELRAGPFAAALAQSRSDDERDVIPAMALLYRAATMIGRDPDREFAAVNEMAGDRASGLVAFTRRASEDRTIEAMGYQEGAVKEWVSISPHLVRDRDSVAGGSSACPS